jgi:hypothetical protein
MNRTHRLIGSNPASGFDRGAVRRWRVSANGRCWKGRFDGGEEVDAAERLGENGSEEFRVANPLRQACDQDDGDVGLNSFDNLCHLFAVHVRHGTIRDDDIGTVAAEFAYAFNPAFRHMNLVTSHLEIGAEELQECLVIIDEQYFASSSSGWKLHHNCHNTQATPEVDPREWGIPKG